MKSDNILECPYNSACGALARGKQGYKKVVFPLITPPWGRLWSVLHWKSCWSVVKCQSTWKHCFTPCEGSSWRHWQRALSSSYPDLVLLSPPGVDICSLFFFFPCPVSTLPTEMSILIPLGYYTSPTLTHKCSYESGMTSQCISSHRLLAHRGLMKTSPGRMTKKKSSALPLGYWEGKSGAAYGHLAFHKNEAHWGELNHERKYYCTDTETLDPTMSLCKCSSEFFSCVS